MNLRVPLLAFLLPFGAQVALSADNENLTTLTPSQMREDLRQLREVWLPQDKSFDGEERKAFEAIVAAAAAKADILSAAEFALEVGRATAAAHNGHTLAALQHWGGFRGLPFKAYWFADGLFIVRVHPEFGELLGARIAGFGPLTPEEALRRVAPYISGTPERVRDLSPAYLRLVDVLHHIGATSSDRHVTVRLALRDGRLRMVRLKRESTADPETLHPSRQLIRATADGPPPPGRWLHVLDGVPELPWAYRPLVDLTSEWLPGAERILYLRSNQIASLDDKEPFMVKLDKIWVRDVLGDAEGLRPRHVVVDLRFNPGGNFINTILMSQALPRLVQNGGKVLVLVGPGTFSAALVTAAMLKGSGGSHVVLVGETMGDAPQFWAEGKESTLKNSGIWLSSAAGYHDWSNGCDDADRCFWANVAFGKANVSLEPEVRVTPRFAEYAAGRDPVLEAALRSIRVTAEPSSTVRSELESMLVSDQLHRGSMVETEHRYGANSQQVQEAWAKQKEIDSRNIKRLDEIVEKHGWPGLSRFGEKATTAAFLVVQHADFPDQQRYLPLLRVEAAKGELPASHLPLLEDRVRRRTGHKQIYGTQLTKNAAGQWEPQPIEDEEHVDERRARAGLEPLSEYIKRNADREKQQRSDVSGNHSR